MRMRSFVDNEQNRQKKKSSLTRILKRARERETNRDGQTENKTE